MNDIVITFFIKKTRLSAGLFSISKISPLRPLRAYPSCARRSGRREDANASSGFQPTLFSSIIYDIYLVLRLKLSITFFKKKSI